MRSPRLTNRGPRSSLRHLASVLFGMLVLTETWIGVRWLAIEIRLLRSVTRKDSTFRLAGYRN
jgi:hypothetical protein